MDVRLIARPLWPFLIASITSCSHVAEPSRSSGLRSKVCDGALWRLPRLVDYIAEDAIQVTHVSHRSKAYRWTFANIVYN